MSRGRAVAAIGGVCCVLGLLFMLATAGVAHGAKRAPLELGVWDPVFLSDDPAERAEWLDHTVDVGAEQVTLQANWRNIAPGPKPADPTNPDDPGYDWAQLDAAVRDASARGLSVMVMLYQAPDWAEGPNREPGADPGTWRPDPGLLGQFARALATRYSGDFPDPLAPGESLPRVTLWQIWGEPNLSVFLTPQWERSNGKWRTASPSHYRRMVNAAYAALNAVDPANSVIAGGLAPAGDYKRGGKRLEPLRFWRDYFCLHGRRALKPKKCGGEKPHLDVLGGNPLSGFVTTNAFKPAVQPDDTWPTNMDELSRIIRAARAHRRIVPRRGTSVWATELLAFTKPPSAFGSSETGQAKYLADALFVLWKQGVSNVAWVGINDGDDYGSGLFRNDGAPKLSAQAFRFPFVARPKGKSKTRVWGMAPDDGPVKIERQNAAGWDAIATLAANHRVFAGRVNAPQKAKLRATAGGEHSLTR